MLNFRVPREDPSGQTLVISSADLQRIRNSARVITDAERRAAAEKIKEEREREMVTASVLRSNTSCSSNGSHRSHRRRRIRQVALMCTPIQYMVPWANTSLPPFWGVDVWGPRNLDGWGVRINHGKGHFWVVRGACKDLSTVDILNVNH